MSRISNLMWLEVVILVALFIAFMAGATAAKAFAMAAIAVLVVFAIPAFISLANSRTRDTDRG